MVRAANYRVHLMNSEADSDWQRLGAAIVEQAEEMMLAELTVSLADAELMDEGNGRAITKDQG
ncbi:MAG: hypothetical protein HJJLKODD_00476 [Phycisphaerae bacterium]|nr:hypothetical protein [Phycisphaerae bacterium]